ncbi:hypothetical protein GYMLUDRAFT_63771 [Collybiopsis luxurians FD-317 M1]|uniref:Uncharacterized protein n=1 Tax=Collybiopsis luxurians FD-317 M1 TaxID=944289 RepID=A0A0D0AS34_9AGAR|nr:hypothetical protein GYMLUDRAFT_63771 [Collybiopsis luxurians FD-317 M1]
MSLWPALFLPLLLLNSISFCLHIQLHKILSSSSIPIVNHKFTSPNVSRPISSSTSCNFSGTSPVSSSSSLSSTILPGVTAPNAQIPLSNQANPFTIDLDNIPRVDSIQGIAGVPPIPFPNLTIPVLLAFSLLNVLAVFTIVDSVLQDIQKAGHIMASGDRLDSLSQVGISLVAKVDIALSAIHFVEQVRDDILHSNPLALDTATLFYGISIPSVADSLKSFSIPKSLSPLTTSLPTSSNDVVTVCAAVTPTPKPAPKTPVQLNIKRCTHSAYKHCSSGNQASKN